MLSRRECDFPEGVIQALSLEEGIELARSRGEQELFVVGGGEIYKAALEGTDRIYLTEVDFEGEADTFFPDFDRSDWKEIESKKFAASGSEPAWEFSVYDRNNLS